MEMNIAAANNLRLPIHSARSIITLSVFDLFMRIVAPLILYVVLFGIMCKKNMLSSSMSNAAYANSSAVTSDGRIMVITCDTTYIDTTTTPPVDTTVIPPPDTIPPPPPEKNIVFYGSSTIAIWNLEQSFPGMPVKKVGYGGKTWSNLVTLADTISKLNPRQVVLYSGDNDVVARRTVGSMVQDIQKLCNKIWEQNPDVHITFLYTKPSDTAFKIVYPDKVTTGITAIEYTNRNITLWGNSAAVQSLHPGKFSVSDTYAPFLLWNPKRLDEKKYQADKLHLNHTLGYPALTKALLPKLIP